MSHTSLQFGLPYEPDRTASKRLLLRASTFFVLASLADLALTIYLIRHPSSSFYESNPIASWVLFTWGISGMTIYKLSLVSLVCLIAYIIAFERRDIAQKLMSSASLIVSCVVLYSLVLFIGNAATGQLVASSFEPEACNSMASLHSLK